MTFEDYLVSKKIDGQAFKAAEPDLYKSWDFEFEQMHVNSFTAQKLYLINPIRLKYTLVQRFEDQKTAGNKAPESKEEKLISDQTNIISSIEVKPEVESKPTQASKPPRPVFKSKPKTN